MKKLILTFIALSFFIPCYGAELKGVKMEDKKTFQKTELVLNAQGLRKVRRFGFPIKVYVAGLYLAKKSSDSDAILASKTPKWIVMQFVNNVNGKDLRDGFTKAVKKACTKCKESLEKLKIMNSKLPSVKDGQRMILGFLPDKVVVEVQGSNASVTDIPSEDFSVDLLRIFLGPLKKVTDKGLRNGLLGLKK